MELKHLRAVVAVADHLHFGHAAAERSTAATNFTALARDLTRVR